MKEKTKSLHIKTVPIDQLNRLSDLARLHQFSNVSEYMRWLIGTITSEKYVAKSEIRYQELLKQYEVLLEVTLKKLNDVDIILKQYIKENNLV